MGGQYTELTRRINVKFHGIATPIEVDAPTNATIGEVIDEAINNVRKQDPTFNLKLSDLMGEKSILLRVGNTVQPLDPNTTIDQLPDGAVIEVQPRLEFGLRE